MTVDQRNIVICPSCGTENIEGSDTCERCMMDLRSIDVPETRQIVSESDLNVSISSVRMTRPRTVGPNNSVREAIAEMTRILNETLPQGFAYEWTDLTYQQMRQERGPVIVFGLAVLLAFLLLAAQYNSWTLPLSVMVVIPTVLSSAIAGLWLAGRDNNIFTQIGLVVLIGLAAKNAILIVEFAKQLEDEGKPRREATIEASKLRLRPILMTSLAFTLGVVPLVLAVGAGAEMRVALGIAVFSGMIGVTAFGIFFTPVFYYVIRWFSERRPTVKKPPHEDKVAGKQTALVESAS